MAGLQALAVKPMSDNVRAGIEKLAVAVKVLDEVKSQVAGTITDGKVATHEAERTSRIAKLTTEQRRWTAW